jgi:hypothetical protein
MERSSRRIARWWWLTVACLIVWATLRPATSGFNAFDTLLGMFVFLQVMITVCQHRADVH